jgi:hypothetical protein
VVAISCQAPSSLYLYTQANQRVSTFCHPISEATSETIGRTMGMFGTRPASSPKGKRAQALASLRRRNDVTPRSTEELIRIPVSNLAAEASRPASQPVVFFDPRVERFETLAQSWLASQSLPLSLHQARPPKEASTFHAPEHHLRSFHSSFWLLLRRSSHFPSAVPQTAINLRSCA